MVSAACSHSLIYFASIHQDRKRLTSVTFISTTAHQKFILQCQTLIENNAGNDFSVTEAERKQRLKEDLETLQQLANSYMNMMAQLPALTSEYHELHKRIRVRLRRIQLTEMNKSKPK